MFHCAEVVGCFWTTTSTFSEAIIEFRFFDFEFTKTVQPVFFVLIIKAAKNPFDVSDILPLFGLGWPTQELGGWTFEATNALIKDVCCCEEKFHAGHKVEIILSLCNKFYTLKIFSTIRTSNLNCFRQFFFHNSAILDLFFVLILKLVHMHFWTYVNTAFFLKKFFCQKSCLADVKWKKPKNLFEKI